MHKDRLDVGFGFVHRVLGLTLFVFTHEFSQMCITINKLVLSGKIKRVDFDDEALFLGQVLVAPFGREAVKSVGMAPDAFVQVMR